MLLNLIIVQFTSSNMLEIALCKIPPCLPAYLGGTVAEVSSASTKKRKNYIARWFSFQGKIFLPLLLVTLLLRLWRFCSSLAILYNMSSLSQHIIYLICLQIFLFFSFFKSNSLSPLSIKNNLSLIRFHSIVYQQYFVLRENTSLLTFNRNRQNNQMVLALLSGFHSAPEIASRNTGAVL